MWNTYKQKCQRKDYMCIHIQWVTGQWPWAQFSQHHCKKPGILEYGSSAKHAILDEHISKSSPFVVVVVVVGDSVVSISVVAVGAVVVVPSSVKLLKINQCQNKIMPYRNMNWFKLNYLKWSENIIYFDIKQTATKFS
jgi:hypothetical protein